MVALSAICCLTMTIVKTGRKIQARIQAQPKTRIVIVIVIAIRTVTVIATVIATVIVIAIAAIGKAIDMDSLQVVLFLSSVICILIAYILRLRRKEKELTCQLKVAREEISKGYRNVAQAYEMINWLVTKLEEFGTVSIYSDGYHSDFQFTRRHEKEKTDAEKAIVKVHDKKPSDNPFDDIVL